MSLWGDDEGKVAMVSLTEFRPRDRWILENLLAFYSAGVYPSLTLEDLVEQWILFVDKLQYTSQLQRQQYEGDLRVRGILAEMEEGLSPDGRQRLLRATADADRRFLTLTRRAGNGHTTAWWMRIPHSWLPQYHSAEQSMRSPVI